jgi:hypothetical protein
MFVRFGKKYKENFFIHSEYLGEDAGDLSALENPKTVEEIGEIGILKRQILP